MEKINYFLARNVQATNPIIIKLNCFGYNEELDEHGCVEIHF